MDDNKLSRIKVLKKDEDKINELEPELRTKRKKRKSRRTRKILITSIIVLLLLSTAFMTLRSYEARVQVRCDAKKEFPMPDDVNGFSGTIKLTNHWYRQYLGGPIVLHQNGRVARAKLYYPDCVYKDNPEFHLR